ncbi:hypothetical protein FB45DRAFT_1036412 [Roridomyces roridus]|uniref:Uncharacterized protein n=1 Tax=Roridomyces roridus TaxID=1738132 RepID=A0AAD7B8B6_9AGAR|nr:hypothetical protein FB45DRAFT_1036412 [Roridomyces roridus]
MDLSVEPQAPGTVLLDVSAYPPPAQELVQKLYTVPDLLCERCVNEKIPCKFRRWGTACEGCQDTNYQCRFEIIDWFVATYPMQIGDTGLLCHWEPGAFSELWYWLKVYGLTPAVFDGCDQDAWPNAITEPVRQYIYSLHDAELLRISIP